MQVIQVNSLYAKTLQWPLQASPGILRRGINVLGLATISAKLGSKEDFIALSSALEPANSFDTQIRLLGHERTIFR